MSPSERATLPQVRTRRSLDPLVSPLSRLALVAACLTEDRGGQTPQGGVGWWAPGGLAAGTAVDSGVSDEDAAEGPQDRPASGAGRAAMKAATGSCSKIRPPSRHSPHSSRHHRADGRPQDTEPPEAYKAARSGTESTWLISSPLIACRFPPSVGGSSSVRRGCRLLLVRDHQAPILTVTFPARPRHRTRRTVKKRAH
jgi:hypothetical protein